MKKWNRLFIYEEKINPYFIDGRDYSCTECKGNAFFAYCPDTIKTGKNKGKQKASWSGLVKPEERLCLECGAKRGIKLF